MDFIGLVFVALFYLVILLGGLWMARQKGAFEPDSWEELVLAKRELGLFLGIFTLIATEVGGAFVNGTAEEVFNRYPKNQYLLKTFTCTQLHFQRPVMVSSAHRLLFEHDNQRTLYSA